MGKKKSINWIEVLIGGGLILIGTLTPIPDDFVTLPLGGGLMAHGLNYI
jgi:hypothetical protein